MLGSGFESLALRHILLILLENLTFLSCLGPFWDQALSHSQALRQKLLCHPSEIFGNPLDLVLIDHPRAGVTYR